MAIEATLTIRNREWAVSLADTPWELAEGLGGLTELPLGTGMLFDTGWMQTIEVTTVPMLFPIDIAFLSETAVVTEVYRNIEPGYIVTSTMPARYFLEVNAGELADIDAGDRATVEFLPLEELPVITPDWMSALAGFMGFAVMAVFMTAIVRDFVKGALAPLKKRPVLYGPRGERLLPQTQSTLTGKWYDRGVEAGKTDGWMTVEDTLAETLEHHPEIKGAHDLVWTDIDLWMETDHFNILYGSKMWEDAAGDADLYSDLESEFWEGYLAGRKAIGVDIYTKASELLKSPQLLPQTVRKREIAYTVNLGAPRHVEEIALQETKAVLKRYGKPVVTFRPTDTQIRKIQQGKGHIHIFADQIEETIKPWRVREALYWPQTGGVALPARILAGLKGKGEAYRAYVKYPPDKSAFVIIGSIVGGHYSWNPQGFSVWVSAWKERPEYPRDSILRIGELRPGRSYPATEEEIKRALDYVNNEYPTFTESIWVSNSIPIYVAQELGILGLERLPQTKATHDRERRGKFKIEQDSMGNIVITHTERPGDVFLQFEADKELVYDILKKSEQGELAKGWAIEIKDTEPRASILEELWETAGPESLPAISVMPKLPKEADDPLFIEYIRDLVRLGERITDEEAKLMWEAWKKRQPQRLPAVAPREGGYSWMITDPETGEIMIKPGYATVSKAKRAAKDFAVRRAKYAGEHPVQLRIYDSDPDIGKLEIGVVSEERILIPKGELIEQSRAPADKGGKTLVVFMEVAEWYVKHRRPMTVKELRPIAAKHFKTEEELTQFYEYLASPEGQREFRRELRATMRRHGIPIPPEEEWLPLTMEKGARFKPKEIVNYKGERVRVLEHIGDRVNIFIPSRQEEVWVKPEALQRIEGKQSSQTGTCYEDAWRFLIKEGEGELVHGTVQTIGKRINHAWVETETGYIWEPESGEFMKKTYFYERAKPRVEARYTAEEAAIMAARTKNLGPWTEQERRQYLKEKSPAVIPTEPRRPRPRKDELEFLPDSPEVLAQTIDAIGYRERIDTAFQEAIKRAKGLK